MADRGPHAFHQAKTQRMRLGDFDLRVIAGGFQIFFALLQRLIDFFPPGQRRGVNRPGDAM